jgi:hypothetical protein
LWLEFSLEVEIFRCYNSNGLEVLILEDKFIFVISAKSEAQFVAVLIAALRVRGINAITYGDLLEGGYDTLSITQALHAAAAVLVSMPKKSLNDGAENRRLNYEAGLAEQIGSLITVQRGVSKERSLLFTDQDEKYTIDLQDWPAPLPWFQPFRQPPIDALAEILAAKLEAREQRRLQGPSSNWESLNFWLVSQWNAKVRSGIAGLLMTALFGGSTSFIFNWNGAQDVVCAAQITNSISFADSCGNLGLGKQPTKQERQDWEAIPKGEKACAGYKEFIQTYAKSSNSELPNRAANLLEAPETRRSETWLNETRQVTFETEEIYAASQEKAKQAAKSAALSSGEVTCAIIISVSPYERLGAYGEVTIKDVNCASNLGGFSCKARYQVPCKIQTQPMIDYCGEPGGVE